MKALEPIIVEEKGTVLTGEGVERVKAVEVEYFNKDNDRSVYNMVSPRIQELLTRDSVQQKLLMDEWELRKMIEPTPTLNRLRISFWREFDRAQGRSTNMVISKVYSGICPREQFELTLLNDDHTVWMLKPPVDYVNAMEEALTFGIDRLREILEVPLYQTKHMKIKVDKDTEIIETYVEFDSKTADLMIKTVAMLDMRVKGAVVQKVEQKTLSRNENVHATLNMTGSMDREGLSNNLQITAGDVDAEIARLEKKLKQDISKIHKPFTNGELNAIADRGINVSELHGIDIDKINSMKSPDLKTKESKNIPPKMVVESSSNGIESAELDEVFGDETIVDYDSEDL